MENIQCLGRQAVYQFAATQRLHDHHGNTLTGGVVESSAAGLRMFVHVVILDLRKVPVVAVNQAAEHIGIAVVGKTHLTDGAAFLFLFQPLLDAHLLQAVPCGGIGEHVHQIVINIVAAQAAQLLLKELFHLLHTFNQVMGQLGGDMHFFAQVILFQNLAQSRFTAGVNVGGIKIVHAAADGLQQLRLCGRHIDMTLLAGKTHTAVTQHG